MEKQDKKNQKNELTIDFKIDKIRSELRAAIIDECYRETNINENTFDDIVSMIFKARREIKDMLFDRYSLKRSMFD